MMTGYGHVAEHTEWDAELIGCPALPPTSDAAALRQTLFIRSPKCQEIW